MTQSQQKTDPGHKGRPFLEEADIGSGEKTPAQMETEEMIRQIPPLPPAGPGNGTAREGGDKPPAKP
jgi:hypothetical protein